MPTNVVDVEYVGVFPKFHVKLFTAKGVWGVVLKNCTGRFETQIGL